MEGRVEAQRGRQASGLTQRDGRLAAFGQLRSSALLFCPPILVLTQVVGKKTICVFSRGPASGWL